MCIFHLLCNECGRKASRMKIGPEYSSFHSTTPPVGWWWMQGTCCLCKTPIQAEEPCLLLKRRRPATHYDLVEYEREEWT